MQPVHTPKNGGQTVNVLGTAMLLRLLGRDAKGTLAVRRYTSTIAGRDVPDPRRRIRIHHCRKDRLCKGADTLFAPRGIAHTHRCVGKRGKLFVVLTPSGFENFFAEIGAMSPQEQQDIPRVIVIAKRYGLEFLSLPGPASKRLWLPSYIKQ